MKKIWKNIRTALVVSCAMFLICGFAYPMALTAVSQLVFPKQANGSVVEYDGKAVGSALVGQDFSDERLFHCRPSAYNYNTYTQEDLEKQTYSGPASGSNNYAPSNPQLQQRIKKDVEQLLKDNPTMEKKDIPDDMITASGSGLDPHISVEAAKFQIDRIAKHTGLSKQELEKLIDKHTEQPLLSVFGEQYVNVLELNVSLIEQLPSFS